jgi:hypothetical protein
VKIKEQYQLIYKKQQHKFVMLRTEASQQTLINNKLNGMIEFQEGISYLLCLLTNKAKTVCMGL